MLPSKNRLTKKEDFQNVYKYGKTFGGENILVKVKENKESLFRVGIVVSTKFSKHAVERNRIKRQIREIIRAQMERLRIGYDVVIIAKRTRQMPEYKDLEFQVINLLKKSNISK